MSAIRLLIADVDGTLVTQAKVLTVRARRAVERLRAAGIAFAIVSGRPPRGMAMLVGPLGLTTPVAAFNGGAFVEPDLTTIIDQHTLPLAASREAADLLLHAGLDVWVYRGGEWFVRSVRAPHVAAEQQTVQFGPTVVPDLSAVLDGAVKLVGVSDDEPLVARCEAELRERLGAHVSAARSQPYYLDVTHPEANKGTVVRRLSRFLGIPADEIATIGDMPSDVLMFGTSGLSIAMGNASREVQRCARQVTTSNEREGFANAVDRFVFGDARAPESRLGLPPGTRACLFDLDGVLTQTARVHAAAWKRAFDDYLRSRARASGEALVLFDEVREYARDVDGKPRLDGVRSFLAARGLPLPEGSPGDPSTAETVHGLAARKDEVMVELLRREPAATYEGSVRYVRAARAAGLRTAVVSSSEHTRQVLASAGIADLFDARVDGIVAAEEHLAGKPAPDTYLAAARALGVAPVQAAVFEDAIAGVAAGRAGHFGYVVGVDRADQGEELRRHGADIVVTDLAALLEQP